MNTRKAVSNYYHNSCDIHTLKVDLYWKHQLQNPVLSVIPAYYVEFASWF